MRRRHVLPVAAALVVALADPAGAAAPFVDSGYALYLRAAAVSLGLGPAAPGAGVTVVNLDKVGGREVGRCETIGAGAYAEDVLRRPDGSDHPASLAHDDEALAVPAGDRDVNPSPSPGGGNWGRGPDPLRDPSGAAGHFLVRHADQAPGPRWTAKCNSDSGGNAVASQSKLAGARTAGSVASAEINRITMRYLGTARAFVTGVATPTGTLDAVTSLVTVTALPGREPTMTYRIGVTDGSVTSVLAAGTDVPLGELAERSNRGTAAGPYGLSLLSPSVSVGEDGTWTVHAPFLELRTGGLTTRLVAVSFSGRQPASAAGTSSAGT